MECDVARDVLSAQLDGEATADDAEAAATHLQLCPVCRVWWSEITAANRLLRVRVAETIPDLAPAVLARAHPVTAGHRQWVRVSLALVAASELMIAAPGLLLGEGAASVHDARHLGSFGVAVAIGLLYVAVRPARAFGILPLVVSLAVTMVVSALFDLGRGRTTSIAEAHHVLELAGLVLVWMLAGRPAPRRLQPLIHASTGRHLGHI
ncbi:MAG: zf-HC2 domain-containing protein [Acidimicrobiia bacterium]